MILAGTGTLHANNYMPEKRIYLVDLSGSMTGLGSVRTENVMDKMKADLKATVNWVPTNTDFVFIPFTEHILPYIKGTNTDKQLLNGHISDLEIMPGNTDIASAWQCALTELDSTKVNYLFLLSDGYHNRGISKQGLYSSLQNWMNDSRNYDAEAYFVLLSPQYRTTEVARIFDSTGRMQVIESMNILRQTATVEEDTVKTSSTVPVISSISDKTFSWCWVWIALIILLIALLIFLLTKLTPMLLNDLTPMSRYFNRHMKMLDGTPSHNGHWSGEKGNSKWYPDREYIPTKGHYCNLDSKTWGEILDSYGIDGINFKKGVPDFSPVSKYPVKFNWEKELSPKDLHELVTSSERSALHKTAYRQMAKRYGFSSVDELKKIKEAQNLVPHERIDGTIELVPRDIHDPVNHKGGINVFQNYYKSKYKI